MSDYESIHGTRVKYLTSDPTLDSSYEGQVWYNSTEGVLKSVVAFGAFASAANMGTARYGHGATGEVSSIIANGGTTGSGTAVSEEYNGSGWAAGGSMNTTRFYISDFGNSQTAAVAVNGRSPGETFMNDVEEYNGTSWTSVTDSPYNANNTNTFGILTAGVAAGGNNPSAPVAQTVAEYDGTNWTAGTSLPTTMRESIVGGTQTAGFVASGGPGPSNNVNHFQYDGTNWTTAGNVNQTRQSAASGGTQTYAIGASGYAAPLIYLTSSSVWDGSSWAAGATVAVGRYASGKGSTSSGTSDVFCGGQTFIPPASYPNPAATEEYNFTINTITEAAWSSTTNLPAAIIGAQGAGTPNAALVFGGFGPAARTDSYKWDGSSWTSAGTVPTGQYFASSGGTQTAAFGAGGYGPSPAKISTTHEYDGSSWSTGGAYPGSIANFAGCGTQTAGLAFGGNPDPNGTSTNHYNGSTWTSSGAMSQNRDGHMSVGIQTAALAIGGYPQLTVVEQYNGSSWTSSPGSLVSAVNAGGSAEQGSTSDAFIFGGNYASTPDNFSARTQRWDGTTWRTDANLGTGRREMAQGIGTTGAALAAGGTTPPNTTAVEEYVPGSTVVTSRTLTSS